MHFRHRQTDTDIVAEAQDVYITSRAKNCSKITDVLSVLQPLQFVHCITVLDQY